jgi:hypothetical protein
VTARRLAGRCVGVRERDELVLARVVVVQHLRLLVERVVGGAEAHRRRLVGLVVVVFDGGVVVAVIVAAVVVGLVVVAIVVVVAGWTRLRQELAQRVAARHRRHALLSRQTVNFLSEVRLREAVEVVEGPVLHEEEDNVLDRVGRRRGGCREQ